EYAMIVEVKTKLESTDVDKHLERISLLRKYFDERNDKRKLIGAVAGGIASEEVVAYAFEKGFFVVEQSGEAISVADTPEGFKPQKW
ncbi:MAG: hypothetical protein FWF83_07150, partial [Clostridiales bacterium]|nr:hypothetical protein [Clostridiales bacterium]